MAKLKSTSIYSSNRLPLIIHNKKKKMKDYTIELMGQCLSKGIAVYSISIHSGYKMCALLTLIITMIIIIFIIVIILIMNVTGTITYPFF